MKRLLISISVAILVILLIATGVTYATNTWPFGGGKPKTENHQKPKKVDKSKKKTPKKGAKKKPGSKTTSKGMKKVYRLQNAEVHCTACEIFADSTSTIKVQ
ncbi:MAG: hypothetical protein M3Q34_01255 [bacterium]|nr:hypothetical protein [bacterium]